MLYIDLFTGAAYTGYETVTKGHWNYPFLDDVKVESKVVLFDAKIAITNMLSEYSFELTVDALRKTQLKGEETITLELFIGPRTATITPNEIVENDILYFCAQDSININPDGSPIFYFTYTKKYYLHVTSKYGSVVGDGWKDENTIASFKVETTSLPKEGLLGPLGAKNVFERWIGDSDSNTPNSTIKMDFPKMVEAVWKDDYTTTYMIFGILGAAAGAGFYLFTTRKKA